MEDQDSEIDEPQVEAEESIIVSEEEDGNEEEGFRSISSPDRRSNEKQNLSNPTPSTTNALKKRKSNVINQAQTQNKKTKTGTKRGSQNKNRSMLEYVSKNSSNATVDSEQAGEPNVSAVEERRENEADSDNEIETAILSPSSCSVRIYFKKDGCDANICKLCHKRLSTPNSTTYTLWRHLKKLHPKEYKECKDAEDEKLKVKQQQKSDLMHTPIKQQRTLPELVENKMPYGQHSNRKKYLDKCLGEMIALDYFPYSVVDGRGFQEFVHKLDPRYKLPSRTTLSRSIVPKLYEEVKSKVSKTFEKDLLSVESLCLMVDIWTSRAGDGYIAFNCQYVNNCFVLKAKTLGCYAFPPPHTGTEILNKISISMDEWKINYGKLSIYIVSDNVANMISALSFSNIEEFYHLLCADHTLQLAIKDAKEGINIAHVLEKLQHIASHYSRSAHAQLRFEHYQKLHGLPRHELLTMVKTRWNSEYILLDRAVEQKQAIIGERAEANADCLTLSEWNMAEGLASVLKPIADVTAPLGSSSMPTASMVLPALFSIEAALQKFINTAQRGSGIMFARKLLGTVRTRFESYKGNDTYILAMALDPRYRLAILSEGEAEEAMKKLKGVVHASYRKKLAATSVNPSEEAETTIATATSSLRESASKSVWSAVMERSTQHNALCEVADEEEVLDAEVSLYLKSKNIHLNADPLKWWKDNQAAFKNIVPLAKHYLGIAATEVSSEHLFSHGGSTVSERRETLTTGHVEQLVFLHENL